jgi:signal transduction histidine kinase
MRRRRSAASVSGVKTLPALLRPPLRDVVLALALVALLETEVALEHLHPYRATIPLFALWMGALAWRRIAPLLMVFVGYTATLIGAVFGVSQHGPFLPIIGVFVALYSLALYATPRRAAVGLAYALACFYLQVVLAMHNGESYSAGDFGFITVLSLAPWLVGKAMRGRLAHLDVLETQAARAERAQEERARAAAKEERARIARELHDVIAHSVSVMVVQAGAAEEVLRQAPERALEPIRAVQDTGRAALAEMARLLGMLRRDAEELGLAPQPGLDDLGALVGEARAAGLPVQLHVEGESRPLPVGADLSAYRIVQEALTNARKHAREAQATVTVRYTSDALELEVLDNGQGGKSAREGGHGLIGMRERVALFGGELDAGPNAGGGFRVHARLPLGDTP